MWDGGLLRPPHASLIQREVPEPVLGGAAKLGRGCQAGEGC